MDLDQLPAALSGAAERVEDLPDSLPARVAEVVLRHTRPPRKSGALEASGRVEHHAVVFGGGRVDYVLPVLASNPFLYRAEESAAPEVLDLTTAAVEDATRL